jgi:hypothetical protein
MDQTVDGGEQAKPTAMPGTGPPLVVAPVRGWGRWIEGVRALLLSPALLCSALLCWHPRAIKPSRHRLSTPRPRPLRAPSCFASCPAFRKQYLAHLSRLWVSVQSFCTQHRYKVPTDSTTQTPLPAKLATYTYTHTHTRGDRFTCSPSLRPHLPPVPPQSQVRLSCLNHARTPPPTTFVSPNSTLFFYPRLDGVFSLSCISAPFAIDVDNTKGSDRYLE